MKTKHQTNDDQSLAKSHSAWSNFKLTILAIMTIMAHSTIFITLGIKDIIAKSNYIILLICSFVIIVLLVICLKNFKR